MKVGVIDYGVGNLGSVSRALEQMGFPSALIDRPADLAHVDRIILPGVGNFADCIRILDAGGWSAALRGEALEEAKPLLGICLGMQLLASSSMEGAEADQPDGVPGLGLIPGRVRHLRTVGCPHRVPHVGWNGIFKSGGGREGGPLDGIPDGTDFYFVHSYAFVPNDPADMLATTDYGPSFATVVGRKNIWGTQFHPEKSSRAGFRLLRNFIQGRPC